MVVTPYRRTPNFQLGFRTLDVFTSFVIFDHQLFTQTTLVSTNKVDGPTDRHVFSSSFEHKIQRKHWKKTQVHPTDSTGQLVKNRKKTGAYNNGGE